MLLHLSTISQRRKTMAAQHRRYSVYQGLLLLTFPQLFIYILHSLPTLLRLLRILLAHELLRNECKPFEWRDEFAHEALHILAQHAVQVKPPFFKNLYIIF